MNSQKIADLEKLLSENKIAEASVMIEEMLSAKGTKEERGESLVNLAALYLDIMNSIDSQYEAVLKEAVAKVKEVNEQQLKKDDEEKLAEVRESLK